MKPIFLTTLAFCAIGCAPVIQTSLDAMCDGTRQARADHAAALAVTTDETALRTGAVLISKIDAGCI